MKYKLVLDANVVVSALFGGIPRKAVLRALKEESYISPEIESEFSALRARLQKKLSFRIIRYWTETLLPSIMKRMRRVGSPPRLKICRDPKDDAYLSLAKFVEADFLITGDKDLLSLSRDELKRVGLSQIAIVTPRSFLNRMG